VYEVGEKWDEEQNKSLNEMDANQKRLSDINPNHALVKKSSEEWTAEDNKEFKKSSALFPFPKLFTIGFILCDKTNSNAFTIFSF
jgi:hypothetical protein